MLYLLRIDFVVFVVRSDESDIDHAVRIVDPHNQSIVVALNIEHHATALKDACAPVLLLHLCWSVPIFLLDFAIPSLQRLFGLRKLLPEDAQGPFGDDSHGEYKTFPKS